MSIINLLPQDYQQQRSRRRTDILCAVLFVLVMIGVGAAAVHSAGTATSIRKAREEINEDYRAAAESIRQIQQLESVKQDVIDRANMAASLLERVPRSYLLACLTNALPDGASMTEVSLETSTIRRAAPKEKPKTKFQVRQANRSDHQEDRPRPTQPILEVSLLVTGLAETDEQVAQFISTVQSDTLFGSVELVFSEQVPDEAEVLRRFQVTMVLDRDAEVPAAEPAALSAVQRGRMSR
ncbi:MAG: PilN domain-containing protein [Planctomycetota bacterium]